MRKAIIIAGLAAACAGALPAAASAQGRCVNPQTNGTTGALVGAAGGAAVGSVLAGRHSRGEGAVLGALGGALIGGAVGHSQVRCPDGYYSYDDQTRTYYDNNGQVYQPNGGGYAQPAYNAQPAYGAPPPSNYGSPPPPPPSYGGGGYDNGPGPGPGYGGGGGDFWGQAPRSIRERISFLRERVQRNVDNGRISPREARQSFADLDDVQRQEMRLRRRDGGVLNGADRDYLQGRLDRARQILRDQRNSGY